MTACMTEFAFNLHVQHVNRDFRSKDLYTSESYRSKNSPSIINELLIINGKTFSLLIQVS